MTNEEFNQRLQDAENGDINAMLDISLAYFRAEGTEKDMFVGSKWLNKAAVGGNSEAKQYLEGMLSELQNGAGKGDPFGIEFLARAYLYGFLVETDFKQAEYWVKKLNTVKDAKYKPAAKTLLLLVGVVLPANNLRELMEGAQKGNANSQYGLGFAYLKGFGVDINPQQAVFWFQKAAEQGHANAKASLNYVSFFITAAGNDPEKLNFDAVLPVVKPGVGAIVSKNPVLWGIVIAAILSYLATGLDIGWLHSLAIIANISWILLLARNIVVFVIVKTCKKIPKQIILGWSILLFLLMIILTICFSVHYIMGRKTENPVSIVLQNPFEAARKHFFTGKSSAGNSEAEADEKLNIVLNRISGDKLYISFPSLTKEEI